MNAMSPSLCLLSVSFWFFLLLCSLREAVNNEEMDGLLLVTLAVDFLLLSLSRCAASITPVTAELFRSAQLRVRARRRINSFCCGSGKLIGSTWCWPPDQFRQKVFLLYLPFTIIFLEQKVCDTMQNASKGSVSVTHPYRNGDRIIGQKAAKILSRRKSGKMSKIKVIPAS
jgi:hypothetical protein